MKHPTRLAFLASLASLARRTRDAVIPACGFLYCQPNRSGMMCAFPRASWHKVEPRSVHLSPSASSWSSPIRSRHNNRLPHPHHCPQGPWLLGQPIPNFAVLAVSAENQKGGREAICDLIDFAVRKDCVRTRTRREPIAHWTKASSQHCLVIHSRPQKVRDSEIRKQEDLLSNFAGRHRRLLPTHTYSKDVYDRLVADILGFAAYPGRWNRTHY
jgi:hypothetical protein